MEGIDPADLRMSFKMWEKTGLLPMGKSIELYGADFSHNEMQNP